jgi:peptidoglycan/xylan/chitin deacetylase (PgdA/CDA1 family)
MCRVLTLMYHRVNRLKQDKNYLAVVPDVFYEQMFFLKKNYPIVRLEQDWNELDQDAVCVTFDDGYMDNYTNALPILQELEIPATIFISTGGINTYKEFWWDELERILLFKEDRPGATFSLKDKLFSCKWPVESFLERDALYDTLVWLIKDKISVNDRENWMQQFRDWSNSEEQDGENLLLQTDQIPMDSQLMTIGAHTVNHACLNSLTEREQSYEIGESVRTLENLFGRTVSIFSYPFGAYNKISIEICKKEHITKAVTTSPGLWTSGCDAYQIPRFIVRNWSEAEYIQRICGCWNSM